MINPILTQQNEVKVITSPVVLGYGPGQTPPPSVLICNGIVNITVTLPLSYAEQPAGDVGGYVPGTGDGYQLTILNISPSNSVTISAATGDTLVNVSNLITQYSSITLCSSATDKKWYRTDNGSGGGTPATPANSIQFNNAGAFGGSANLTWDGSILNITQGINFTTNINTDVEIDAVTNLTTIGANQSGDRFIFLPEIDDGGFTTQALYIMDATVYATGTNGSMYILNGHPYVDAGASTGTMYGVNMLPKFGENTSATNVWSYHSQIYPGFVTNIGTFTQFGADKIGNSGTPTVTTTYSFWSASLVGMATNPYSFWSDEQGVYRIKTDNTFNSVYQAIPALYNPQFTKYTPGAANYERIVTQWESNVAVVTTEKGGTGTLRNMRVGDSSGIKVDVPGLVTTAVTVGTLPASPVAGQRSFVTDSNAASFTAGIGAIVASGGTTKVPVVYDGTNWRIG